MKTQTLNIKGTEFSNEANIISLNSIPTIQEQSELFSNNCSVVLEF